MAFTAQATTSERRAALPFWLLDLTWCHDRSKGEAPAFGSTQSPPIWWTSREAARCSRTVDWQVILNGCFSQRPSVQSTEHSSIDVGWLSAKKTVLIGNSWISLTTPPAAHKKLPSLSSETFKFLSLLARSRLWAIS